MPRYRSHTTTQGRNMAGARALWRATGMTNDDFDKPIIAIANSFTYNLLIRAADVTLKERRPLVLMVRETPLHKGHLDLMSRVADYGGIILPPMPAFYHKPQSVLDIVHQSLGKALDQVGIEHHLFERWSGQDRGPTGKK